MAYDEGLAERIRDALPDAVEKKMFGGIAWMERGSLVVGVLGDELIARVGPDDTAAALAEEGTRPFDFTGRPMKGWVMVDPEVIAEEPQLHGWVQRCREFVATLPAK